jgi:hypothetical protein
VLRSVPRTNPRNGAAERLTARPHLAAAASHQRGMLQDSSLKPISLFSVIPAARTVRKQVALLAPQWKGGAVPVSEDSPALVACCMSARPEYLRQLARKCAIKAAATKNSAARASFEAERKQLLRLAEQAERGERNRRASPMTGLRSSSMIGRWKK